MIRERVGIEEIMRMIPHRYPFLLIDRVEDIVEAQSATGVKNVTSNEPHFTGHFPQKPIMPGVLIVEALAQTASVLVVESLGLVDSGSLVYFMTVDATKFRRLVQPGDTLHLKVEVLKHRGKIWRFEGKAFVGDELAAESTFQAMIVPPEEA